MPDVHTDRAQEVASWLLIVIPRSQIAGREARRILCLHTGLVPPSQYATADGPLIALAALVVVILLCRWVFSTKDRDARTAQRLAQARNRGDYGLLVAIATVRTEDDAELLRGVLRAAGIRGTVADGDRPGDRVVLVFRSEADRARQLVAR